MNYLENNIYNQNLNNIQNPHKINKDFQEQISNRKEKLQEYYINSEISTKSRNNNYLNSGGDNIYYKKNNDLHYDTQAQDLLRSKFFFYLESYNFENYTDNYLKDLKKLNNLNRQTISYGNNNEFQIIPDKKFNNKINMEENIKNYTSLNLLLKNEKYMYN